MTPQASPMGHAPVVAVVDDDPAVCNSLKFSLELEGFRVRTYGGGAELLRAVDLAACNCFVVDQKMPNMSGLEVIAKLRDRRIAAPAILIISEPSVALERPRRQGERRRSSKSRSSAMHSWTGFATPARAADWQCDRPFREDETRFDAAHRHRLRCLQSTRCSKLRNRRALFARAPPLHVANNADDALMSGGV